MIDFGAKMTCGEGWSSGLNLRGARVGWTYSE